MHFPNRRYLAVSILVLAFPGAMTGCGVTEGFSRYQTADEAPVATGTFVVTDYRNCGGFPASTITGALVPPLFSGPGQVGVGYDGQLVPESWHNVHRMQGAVRFNLDGIPAGAANPLIAATLRFRAVPTSRSGLDDPSCSPVNRVERAASGWDETSSDFTVALPGQRVPVIQCEASGARYECDVSRAVQDWRSDPVAYPNNGFVIQGPAANFNACNVNIGPPGNLLECAAEMRDIELVIQYLPPDGR